MAASGTPEGTPFSPSVNQLAGPSLIEELPPEVQQLLKPGKTPDRIQHAITWAARRDPAVIRAHQARRHAVTSIEDIRALKLDEVDTVAIYFATKYRRRALLTGAITGLPGGLWALIAAGADVQLTAAYAVRMAADIAQAYGYDTADVEEQAHLAEVLALAAGLDSVRGIGNWLTREGLLRVLPELLPRVLARVSVELTEEQAAKFIGRIIPGVGAIIGGAIDYSFMRVAGDRAIAYYHRRYMIDHGLAPALLPEPASASTSRVALPPGAQTLPGSGAANVVEGSLVAPQQLSAAVEQQEQEHKGQHKTAKDRREAQIVAALTTPSSAQPKKRKKRLSAPERIAIFLSIFALCATGITVLALYAIFLLISAGVHNLIH